MDWCMTMAALSPPLTVSGLLFSRYDDSLSLLLISHDRCSMLPLLLTCIPAQNSHSRTTWVHACPVQCTAQTIPSSIVIWAAGFCCFTVILVCLLQQDITSWLSQAWLILV